MRVKSDNRIDNDTERSMIAAMAQSHKTWKEAHTAAVLLARESKKEVGIERMVQFGNTVFLVHRLPAEQFRQGYELRCEIVSPTDPL